MDHGPTEVIPSHEPSLGLSAPVILAYFFGYAILVVMIFPLNANGAWSK
jgi:hypothetical protein